ncbi:MAG: hypothetical protein DBY38_00470 [Clostridium cadaveris]|uniref:Manganese efflux pump MntP n=1 Tax=Clostridium cadaveris TaxID=1529 RepID=A0A316MTP4_9CLOT|nr:manganese efflux pump [Clostridium sp.]PWL55800.1 MAG: hypothetical protein DBY38_00470 [Clostridium cadaveris]
MSILEVIIVSIGLSLDSLAVTIYKGANQASLKKHNNILVGFIFGGVQALMLTIGMMITWFPVSSVYTDKVIHINQWFSAIIFIFLGLKMCRSAISSKSINEHREDFSYKVFASLAFATSIDALILGIGIALLGTEILVAILLIFIFTSILSMVGLSIGYRIGDRYRITATVVGSIILLVMGVKTILTYFQVI